MKILITGSNGLLGQKLLHTLNGNGYDLYGCDLSDEPFVTNVSHTYIPLDLTDRRRAIAEIRRLAPNIIIHTAAMTEVDRCELEREKCWNINVFATDHILHGAAKTRAKVIFISSDYVFDGVGGPFAEDTPPNPVNYYGKSKLAAENLVRGSNVPFAILRTIVLYGVGINARASFVTWLLGQLRAGREVHIVNDQWGNTTIVDDLAAGIERIILLGKEGLYHIAGHDYMTRYEFALKVAQTFGLNPALIHPIATAQLKQPAKRPLRSGLDMSKAEADLFITFHDTTASLEIYREQEAKLIGK